MTGKIFDQLVSRFTSQPITAQELCQLVFDEPSESSHLHAALTDKYNHGLSASQVAQQYPFIEHNSINLARAIHCIECLRDGRLPPSGGLQDDGTLGYDQLKPLCEVLLRPQALKQHHGNEISRIQGEIDTLTSSVTEKAKEINQFNEAIAEFKRQLSDLRAKEKFFKENV